MVRKILLPFFFLLGNFGLFAQNNATIAGRILENNQALPFATIVLNDDAKKSMITGALSDENGYFNLEGTGYLNFSLNYKHQFPESGHELNLGAQYVRGWEDESYFLNDSSAVRVGRDATNILAIENTTSITADYVKPLRSGRIEVGAKIQIRTIPVTYEITRGQQSIIYEGIGDFSDWGENIYAAYVNYVLEKEKMDIEGGLRIEQANVFKRLKGSILRLCMRIILRRRWFD